MSIGRLQVSDLELRFNILNNQFQKLKPDMPGVMQVFNQLVEEVKNKKDIDGLFKILEKYKVFLNPDESPYKLEFVHLILKVAKYGLSQKNGEYKPTWELFVKDQLSDKIIKLQKKVNELKQNPWSTTQVENTPKLSKATKSPSKNSIFGSISKAVSERLRSPSLSKSASFDKQQSPSRPSVFSIFNKPHEELVVETPKTESEVVSASEVKEFCWWNSSPPFFNLLPQDSLPLITDFKKSLLMELTMDSAYNDILNSCKDEEEKKCLRDALNFHLDAVLFEVNEGLDFFIKNRPFTGVMEQNFIAYAFLFHLYDVSLVTDFLYIENGWQKPMVLHHIQNMLHFEKQLKELKFDLIPSLCNRWDKILRSELQLAYSYFRYSDPKNFNTTKYGFDKKYPNDPLTLSGCGHRKSASKLPQCLLKLFAY